MTTRLELTQADLHEQFDYNPDTGELIRKFRNPTGKPVGTLNYKNNGTYPVLSVTVNKKHYLVHRVIWLYMTGSWPDTIDHINHDSIDNRWDNLRSVSRATNKKNCKKYENNSSGITGVHKDISNGRYRASIAINGRSINLYSGTNFEEACVARRKAELEYGFHRNHGK